MIPELGPAELASWLADTTRTPPVLIDVREPWEFDYCRIESSVPIPLGQLAARRAEVPGDRSLVIVCHHGNRSWHAAGMLLQGGFVDVYNLRGGVEAWAADVEPTMRRY